MPTRVILPPLGESITEATLLRWLKAPGDPVRRGDELAEIETAKASLPLEAPADGSLLALLAQERETVIAGQLLAVIGAPGEIWPAAPSGVDANLAEAGREAPAARTPAPALNPQPASPLCGRVSPNARRLAKSLGVDLARVEAATPGGRVTGEDVERHAAARAGAASARRLPLNPLRQAVAARMAAGWREMPQFSVTTEADAAALLEQLTARPITLTAALACLTVQALQAHPRLNARFSGEAVSLQPEINLAIAVAAPDGLRAPVLRDAARLSMEELALRLAELVEAARAGRGRAEDLAEATFTLSNLGMYGVAHFVPLAYLPQVAILGVGAARPRFIPDEASRPRLAQLLSLTVTADHRALDGAEVAGFLHTLRQSIEQARVE
jgi:pyruvate dehydrogenase E2 component (dihydrolipoamide acetyltransferase)